MRFATTPVLSVIIAVIGYSAVADAKIYGTPKYVVGGPVPPPGYVTASLSTVQDETFAAVYNNDGLPDAGELLTPIFCPQLTVREGLLLTGSLGNPQAILPFGPSGTSPQRGRTLQGPVYIGSASASRAYNPLTSSEQAQLFTRPVTGQKARQCNSSFYVLYERASFSLYGFGPGFPTGAPQTGARLANIADIRSPVFARAYEATNGLGDFGEKLGDSSCCAVYTAEGPLAIAGNQSGAFNGAPSTVIPYNTQQRSQCGVQGALSTPVYLGTAAGSFFRSISPIVQAQVTAGAYPPSCTGSSNMYALYAVPETPAPTPAPPASPQCVEVDFQVAYYNPANQGICLADLWRTILHMNKTYTTLEMSSLDECAFGVSMSNVVLKPYTDTHFYAYAGGASQCPCTGYGFVPYGEATERTTMCEHKYDEFHFCNLDISLRKVVQCPPPPPLR